MESGRENRTEKPTPRRLQKAREKGQVARSREVPPALVLMGGLLVLYYSGQTMLGTLAVQMRDILRMRVPNEITVPFLQDLLQGIALRLGSTVGILMIAALCLGIGAN